MSPFPPPLSCSEPEMRLPLGAFFFLFQRRLAETPEPRRLAPGPIPVSEQPSVSNRANLVRYGSASRRPAFSAVSRSARLHLLQPFFRLACPPKKCSVGVSRRGYGQLFEMDLSWQGRAGSSARLDASRRHHAHLLPPPLTIDNRDQVIEYESRRRVPDDEVFVHLRRQMLCVRLRPTHTAQISDL